MCSVYSIVYTALQSNMKEILNEHIAFYIKYKLMLINEQSVQVKKGMHHHYMALMETFNGLKAGLFLLSLVSAQCSVLDTRPSISFIFQ